MAMMTHLFFLDMLVTNKQERLLEEATRERLVRELNGEPQGEDRSECTECPSETAEQYGL